MNGPTIRVRSGFTLAGMGVLLVAFSMAMLFIGMRPAIALDDPTNSNKELLCHNLNGPPSPSDGISVDKSAVVTAHPDAGHNFDIIEGQFSDALGRIAVAADIAIIGPGGSITWVCGTVVTTTTVAESTTTTVAETTTTVGGPSTTTTTVGGPCNPAETECLPNTGVGGGGLVFVLLTGLGLLFLGVGALMVSDARHRKATAA